MTSATEREALSGISAEAYKSRLKHINFNYDYLNGQPYKEAKAAHDDVRFLAEVHPSLMPLYLEARSAA